MRDDETSEGERPREERSELAATDDGDAELVEVVPAEERELAPAAAEAPLSMNPVRLIERFQLAQLRSRKELEAVEIVLDSRLEEMRNAADAAAQESKARWDARSAEVVSAMKTVVQARLRGIENERMAHRFESIENAYELFATKVREVETGPLPEELREDLIRKLRENLTATIERLESDAIADQYDLKD